MILCQIIPEQTGLQLRVRIGVSIHTRAVLKESGLGSGDVSCPIIR